MMRYPRRLSVMFLTIVCSSTVQAEDAGRHDMLLLLPGGPVHLRVQIMDDAKTLEQTRADYLTRLVASLDTDQDGKLSRTETQKHPLFVSGRRFEGNKFLDSLRSSRPYTTQDLELAVDRAAGQLVTYRQNNALADQDLSVFRVLDRDESGLIDRVEMQLSPARIAERDSDFDQCVTFDEFLTTAPTTMQGALVSPLLDEPPGAVHSEMLRDATEPILAARLVRRYDTDRDAHLTADELGWKAERLESLDVDQDGKLSMQEMSRLATAEPDMSLTVDLHQSSSDAMQLVSAHAADVEVARSDLIRLQRGGLSLSVSYRHRDPMAEANANAADTFNAIDVDANGYLDRDEIAEHQRFARYLFDAMDQDDDDRVFAEEMMSYVKQYTEPASTTCQVTLLDNGNGFFQILDTNADGRISIRELRQCETQLLNVAGNESAINPSRLTKSYRIEIQRGGVGLFGRVDRPTMDTPEAFLKPPSGPIWFQRMDRNGDGDLTWDEFLGPRDVFHQTDADHDDLIDEAEATQATKDAT
ncbi:EF-hand domain-containing protein [Allorhodopirellula heiligendammensis]|uniref:Transaldolase/EF-hand domain-containing protein n=1 Tax=Allorhodopirellula heiligendammensis TaxID=2714739 RepID=A0A5C6BHA6_9BACT|nr:EF-hand domain-containing protein [Allorhodopirellula heiligendammensis]TWU11057.1 transaldolase/EF-hand domain-containing protein [Allorhodopirellula heiligendammensis]